MTTTNATILRAAANDRATPALTSRYFDFWLLGGASIVVWLVAFCGEYLRPYSWAFDHHYKNLAAISGTVALLVNYPHFMASYKLAYEQGPRFIGRFWLQLIAVPAVLLGLMTLSWFSYQDTETGRPALDALVHALQAVGLSGVGQGPIGRELMGLLVNFMYFTVGWHYSKQTFGCMMVQARYDRYPLTALQRRLLKAGLFSIWAASYAWANQAAGLKDFFGVPYLSLGLPAVLYPAALGLFGVCTASALIGVVVHNARTLGVRPSANFLVPWIAFVVWWLPPLIQTEFFFYVVPFFHSLQYLTFVYRVESTRLEREHATEKASRGTLTALALIVAGFLTFELLPNSADVALGAQPMLGAWFFAVAAHVFVNVHHYFIDNVIWRSGNRAISRNLS